MTAGLTLTVIVPGAVPEKVVVPSESVPETDPEPVTFNVRLVVDPLQMDADPLILAVGLWLTFITTLPVRSPARELHDASLNPVIVYVFDEVGDTLNVYGFEVIPLTVVVVVPSL